MGIPALSSQISVTIRIQRLGLPSFDQDEYTVTFNEDYAVGNNIVQLQATDPLNTRLQYDITGETNSLIMFRINSATGQITLAQSFRSDPASSFLIRVEAFRTNDPTKRASTKVRVFVTRNTGAPAFIHGNLEVTILEDQALAVGISDVNATDPDTVSFFLCIPYSYQPNPEFVGCVIIFCCLIREKMVASPMYYEELIQCPHTRMSISTSIQSVGCCTSPSGSRKMHSVPPDMFFPSQPMTMAFPNLLDWSLSLLMLFVIAMDQFSPAAYMKPLLMNQHQLAPVLFKSKPQMVME